MIIVFIIVVIWLIYYSITDKEEKRNQQVKRNNDFKIECSKSGNRQLLKQYGDERFILLYGEDQFNSIKNDTDKTSVQLIDGWEDRIRKEYMTYVC